MLNYVYTVHQTLFFFSKQHGKSCFPRYVPYECFMFGGGGVGWGCWGCNIALKPQYSPLLLARSGPRLDGNRWADRWRPRRRPRPRLDRQSPGRAARCSPPQWFPCCWGPGWSLWALLVTVPTQSVSLALGHKLKRENFFCDQDNYSFPKTQCAASESSILSCCKRIGCIIILHYNIKMHCNNLSKKINK